MSPNLIKTLAAQVYGIAIADERCDALSQEQQRFADRLRAKSDALDFDTATWAHAVSVSGCNTGPADDV